MDLTDGRQRPLRAVLPVPDGAVRLLEAVHDVVEGDAPDGFRASQLVDATDGAVQHKVAGYHRLARLSGIDVTERTVRNWVEDLTELGLVTEGEYEHRAGRPYAAEIATLKSALQVISHNPGFKVAAVQRFRGVIDQASDGLDWLAWARRVFDLTGERSDVDPPPGSPG